MRMDRFVCKRLSFAVVITVTSLSDKLQASARVKNSTYRDNRRVEIIAKKVYLLHFFFNFTNVIIFI